MPCEIDYKYVDELVKNSSKMFPEIDTYVLWVMACDHYIREVANYELPEDEDKEELRTMYERSQKEYKIKEYNTVVINDISANIIDCE